MRPPIGRFGSPKQKFWAPTNGTLTDSSHEQHSESCIAKDRRHQDKRTGSGSAETGLSRTEDRSDLVERWSCWSSEDADGNSIESPVWASDQDK